MKFGMPGFVVPVVMSSRESLSIFDYGDGTFRTKLVTGKIILTDYLLKSYVSTNLYASLWFWTKDAAEQSWLHRPLQCRYLLKLGLKEVVTMFCFF